MKGFRVLLIIVVILSLTLSSAFAKKENSHFKVGDLSSASEEEKEKIALDFLGKQMKNGDFRIKNKYVDGLDMTTVRVDQYYNNTKVLGADLIVNIDKNGVIKSVIGEVLSMDKKVSKSRSDKIKKTDALDIALKDLGFEPVLLEKPKPEEILYPSKNGYDYTYEIELVFDDPTPARWFYYVDATSGKIIYKYNSNTVSGTGTDVLGNNRVIETYYYSGEYYMIDTTRGNGIYTYDARKKTRLPGNYWIDADNYYYDTYDAPAVSSQYYLGVVYDYYLDKFGRNSFDNNGATIYSSVHVGRDYNNAYWNGRQFAFGDGDGSYFIPLSGALDVVAHEFTHAVTEHTAGLIYQDESGALNEAMSDIMGTAVEYYLNESPDWLLGEDIVGPGFGAASLRSMADPTLNGDPDHYSDIYTGTQDYGGVHTNNGVINKVAYLIGVGGYHYGTNVQGQGIEVVENVFYRALTHYMTSSTDFHDARLACIQAATDLYGYGSSQVTAVTSAFSACGIY